VSGSRRISELTSATVLTGSEIFPIVQDGETRQVAVTALNVFQLVRSVNGLTGTVILTAYDIAGLEQFVKDGLVSAAIASVSVRVDTVSALVSGNTTNIAAVSALVSANTANIAAVSALVSSNTLYISEVSALVSGNTANIAAVSALVSVETARLANVSALVSANTAAINAVSVLAARPLPYDISFDFGTTTVPTDQYAAIVAVRTFYVLPSCSNSQLTFNTSAFPASVVTVALMYPTSVTLGVITIDVSGTATWPAQGTHQRRGPTHKRLRHSPAVDP